METESSQFQDRPVGEEVSKRKLNKHNWFHGIRGGGGRNYSAGIGKFPNQPRALVKQLWRAKDERSLYFQTSRTNTTFEISQSAVMGVSAGGATSTSFQFIRKQAPAEKVLDFGASKTNDAFANGEQLLSPPKLRRVDPLNPSKSQLKS